MKSYSSRTSLSTFIEEKVDRTQEMKTRRRKAFVFLHIQIKECLRQLLYYVTDSCTDTKVRIIRYWKEITANTTSEDKVILSKVITVLVKEDE